MQSSELPSVCIKCGNNLTDTDKEIGLPLCQNCIDSLTSNIMGKMKVLGEKKIEQEVDHFTRFISSSGHLFGLDDITILQCCFNIFMKKTVEMEDKNLVVSGKIFSDAIKFIEKELEDIEIRKTMSGKANDKFISMFDGMRRGNGSEDKEGKGDKDKKGDKEEK